MYKHYYLNKQLRVVSITGSKLGVEIQPIIPINYKLSQTAPEIATKINHLITNNKIDHADFHNETPLYFLGSFKLTYSEKNIFFKLWTICENNNASAHYLLESATAADHYSINNINTDIINNIEVSRFKDVIKLASVGILQIDNKWRTLYVSKSWSDITGYCLSQIAERDWIQVIHESDRNTFLEQLHQDMLNEKNSEQDVRIQTASSGYHWFNVHYRINYDPHNQCQSIIFIFVDIHHKRERHEYLKKIAMQDLLTQIGNRYAFQEHLQSAIRKLHSPAPFHLIFLDLDGFKAVNDAYGHLVGDKLLQEVAKRLYRVSDKHDFIARLGGDEFAIIRNFNAKPSIRHYATELLHAIARPYALVKGAEESYVSASVGIVAVPTDTINYSDTLSDEKVSEITGQLLRQVDAAMYNSKESGRNTYRFYAAELDDSTRKKLMITDALHRALEKNEFILHYQPQWSCKSASIYGYEALIRWDSATFDIGPEEFIPLVENSGLMGHIGRWVFERALRDHAQLLQLLEERGEYSHVTLPQLSVNFSPMQFRDQNLHAFIKQALQKYRVPAETVTIEITENLLNTNFIEISSQLKKIKTLGANIALDDFGTGYSGLSSLYKFPIDIIKIDKQFISDLHVYDTRQVVLAILKLSHVLNKKVLVEGVETSNQLEYLRSEGADIIQGWLIAKALPFAELKDRLMEQPVHSLQPPPCLLEAI